MSDSESLPPTSHETRVCAQLSFRAPPPPTSTKKKSTAKGTIQTKNKEFPFTFESGEKNYLSFLSAVLDKHGYNKFTPVVKKTCFPVKYILGGKAYISNLFKLISLSCANLI